MSRPCSGMVYACPNCAKWIWLILLAPVLLVLGIVWLG